MPRQDDINTFYKHYLNHIIQNFPVTPLAGLNPQMPLHFGGVYFIFEPRELRTNGEHRVTRVGQSGGGLATLNSRLDLHLNGGHAGSSFRKHVGNSIINRGQLGVPLHAVEHEITHFMQSVSFTVLQVDDADIRKSIESKTIALLSNLFKPPIDPPSPQWLGLHSINSIIVQSGIWNVAHAGDPEDNDTLFELLEGLI